MNTENASKYLDGKQITDRSVWDSKGIERPLECLLEDYHQEQLKLLDIGTAMHWVAVDERLPNEHQDVMVYYYGNKNSKHFPDLQFMKQSSFYNGSFECDEEVTHWAILPEPPCA